jgi:hypothetical protein
MVDVGPICPEVRKRKSGAFQRSDRNHTRRWSSHEKGNTPHWRQSDICFKEKKSKGMTQTPTMVLILW